MFSKLLFYIEITRDVHFLIPPFLFLNYSRIISFERSDEILILQREQSSLVLGSLVGAICSEGSRNEREGRQHARAHTP